MAAHSGSHEARASEPIRLSVAVSDTVLSATCFYLAFHVLPVGQASTPVGAAAMCAVLGLLHAGAAAALGVLRFGTGALRPWHEGASRVAGIITPALLATPFAWHLVSSSTSLPTSVVYAVLATGYSLCMLSASAAPGTLVGALSYAACLAWAFTQHSHQPIPATLVSLASLGSVVSGLVIGTSLDKRILGIRRVDWFHVLFALAVGAHASALHRAFL